MVIPVPGVRQELVSRPEVEAWAAAGVAWELEQVEQAEQPVASARVWVPVLVVQASVLVLLVEAMMGQAPVQPDVTSSLG